MPHEAPPGSRRAFLLGRVRAARRVARIGEACLARAGVHCRSCGDACAEGAIRFRPVPRRAPLPEVDGGRCTCCGECVAVCPAAAIALDPEAADAG
jgi:formate hydrogenlyase subunit 6/NADH:ubiquinone oxidoreductase subunit I